MRNSVLLLFLSVPCFCAPVCNPGAQQTFVTGSSMTLDGSGSTGTGTLSYAWSQLSGPTTVSWSSTTVAKPTLTGTMSFGSYVFQLIVTDSVGSTTCTVKDGWVPTDALGNVIINGGSSDFNAAATTLLGTMIPWGKNPWPWMDDRHKAAADFNIGHLADFFISYWTNYKGPGTITVTAGSATVAGVGTDFTTRFCQGPLHPTLPKNCCGGQNVYVSVWYPMTSPVDYSSLPANTGLRSEGVLSCQSDTQLTINENWPPWTPDCSSGGCSYSFDDADTVYTVSPAASGYAGIYLWPEHAGSNFYDAVSGFYSLYYRSGIDDYLVAARTLADRDWKYRLQSGLACYFGGGGGAGDRCGGSIAPRTWSILGMVLRALDGRPDMWVGLENMFTYASNWILNDDIHWGIWDPREQAYLLLTESYGALYDPTPANRTSYLPAISAEIGSVFAPNQYPDGSWQVMEAGAGSWSNNTSVSLTNGSTSVVGNGTTFSSFWASNPTKTSHIVFFNGTSEPANNAATENVYYTASYVSDTALTLDRPYAGVTGTHGWVIGGGFCPNDCYVGYGAQPFMLGILGFAFDMASRALATSDPTNSAKAHKFVSDIVGWQRNSGYRSSVKGMQYMVNTVDCTPPIDDSMTWCTAGMAPLQSRELNAELTRSIIVDYNNTKDPGILSFANTLYNAMWAMPGTCPTGSTLCVSDGYYLSDWDPNPACGAFSCGWYITGDNADNRWHKYFGMSFGIGAGADWPAALVAGSSMRPIIGAGTVLGTGVVR